MNHTRAPAQQQTLPADRGINVSEVAAALLGELRWRGGRGLLGDLQLAGVSRDACC
jgi:hypothetical protein